MSEEIKLPFDNGFCDTCRHQFVADDTKVRCHAHTRRTVLAECAKVKSCRYYLRKESKNEDSTCN